MGWGDNRLCDSVLPCRFAQQGAAGWQKAPGIPGNAPSTQKLGSARCLWYKGAALHVSEKLQVHVKWSPHLLWGAAGGWLSPTKVTFSLTQPTH